MVALDFLPLDQAVLKSAFDPLPTTLARRLWNLADILLVNWMSASDPGHNAPPRAKAELGRVSMASFLFTVTRKPPRLRERQVVEVVEGG